MSRPLFSLAPLAALALPLLFAAAVSTPGDDDPPAPLRVTVPIHPNVACPIMGKPISTRLFVDTELGRFWVCCKGCDEEVLENVAAAHRTAYPIVSRIENERCPISTRPIDDEAPTLVLQGYELALCCEKCAPAARADSQAVLARLVDPRLEDLGNRTCPVSGEPAEQRTIVAIGRTIVRLSSPRLVADVEREPDAVLAKAREIRARELEEERRKEKEREESEKVQRGAEGSGRD